MESPLRRSPPSTRRPQVKRHAGRAGCDPLGVHGQRVIFSLLLFPFAVLVLFLVACFTTFDFALTAHSGCTCAWAALARAAQRRWVRMPGGGPGLAPLGAWSWRGH